MESSNRSRKMEAFLGRFLDFFFPSLCPACNSPFPLPSDSLICDSCLSKINVIDSPICKRCGIPFETTTGPDHLCSKCITKEPTFDWARSLFTYEGPVAKLIKGLKFGGDKSCLKSLAWVSRPLLEIRLASVISDLKNIKRKKICVIPVPLHNARLRKRTFNQSLLLARELFPGFVIERELLARCCNSPPQTGLNAKMRRKNVKGVFRLTKEEAVKKYSYFIIVDDVMTTGSTVDELAKELKRKGADTVGAITIARSLSPT